VYQGNPGKRIRVGGIEMEYEEHGAGDRPFVLVHGFTGSRDDWKEHLPLPRQARPHDRRRPARERHWTRHAARREEPHRAGPGALLGARSR
jgi:pimeloyl-ACP methyl ester carboxylesterase